MRDVDFTPDWYLESLQERQGSRLRVVGMVAIGVLIVVWYVHSVNLIRSARAEAAQLTQSLVVQQTLAAQLDQFDREHAEAKKKQQMVDNLGGGLATGQVIAEITRMMPATMSLQSVRLRKSARLSSDEIDEDRATVLMQELSIPKVTSLEVSGWAANGINVGGFVSALGESPMISDVTMRFQRTETHLGREVTAFEVVALMPQFE